MINPMSLERKNIIVTGAASGIGKETAVLLSELGADLLLLDTDKEGLCRTKDLLKSPAETKVCDLTEFHLLKELVISTKNKGNILGGGGGVYGTGSLCGNSVSCSA